MRRLLASTGFGAIATLAYAGLTWRHQPGLMDEEAARPLAVDPWTIVCLAVASLLTFTCAWWLFLRLSKRRRPWAAGLAGAVAAALVPILHLWIHDAAGALLFVRQASSDPGRPVFAVTIGLMELILRSGLWYAVSLAAIAWFTIPLSAGLAVLFLLTQERLGLSERRERPGPPAPR